MNISSGSSSPTFRIDVIFNSLHELRQEKERLQQYYNEEKARRKSLENKLEACQARFHQCSEKNIKMIETVNAARQKVLQTQNQANKLKGLNDEKDVKINELRKQIEEGYKNEERELKTFEAHLEELTDNFRDAKNFYTQENLTKEMEEWRKQAEEATAEAGREDNSLKEVTEKFHQLELETNNLKEKMKAKLEFDVSLQELQSALMVFEEMDKEVKEELVQFRKQLQLELQKLEEAKKDYKSKRPAECTVEPLNSDGQETSQSNPMVEDSTGGISSSSHESHFQSVQPTPSERNEQPSEDYCHYQFPCIHPAPIGPTALKQANYNEGEEVYKSFRQVLPKPQMFADVSLSYNRAWNKKIPLKTDNKVIGESFIHAGGSVHQTQGRQSEQRRTSLQGRSFFISLPFTSNN